MTTINPVGNGLKGVTGSGNFVGATSPTLVTPVLGTPTSGTLTNCTGGGGYTMYKDAPVVSRSSAEIRDLIMDWVERHKEIPATPTNNWRLLP